MDPQIDFSSLHDYGYECALDSQGNVILAGQNARPPPATGNTGRNAFIIKYDSSGNLVWSNEVGNHAFANYGDDAFFTMRVDSNDNVYAAGTLGGPHSSIPNYNYLHKYTSAGSTAWTKTFTSGAWNESYGMGLDDAGSPICVGRAFVGWGANRGDWVVQKYNSAGTQQSGYPFYYNFSGSELYPDRAYGVASWTNGDFTVVGSRGVASGNYDWHVRHYNVSRVLQWSDTIDSASGSDFCQGVNYDSEGNVIVCGYTKNPSGTDLDWRVIKYASTNGAVLWDQTYESSLNASDNARHLVVEDDDNLLVTGVWKDSGRQTRMLARISGTDGSLMETQTFPGTTNEVLLHVDARDGMVALAGYVHNGNNWDMFVSLNSVSGSGDPIGEWRFDEGSGSNAFDSSSSSNHGVIAGASYSTMTATGSASALSFDGVDDGVTVSNFNPGALSNFTISSWIYSESSNGDQTLIRRADSNGFAWALRLTNEMVAFEVSSDGTNVASLMTGQQIPPTIFASNGVTGWRHVAGVVDGGAMQIFIDGALSASSNAGVSSVFAGATQMTFGANGFFDGFMDEIRVYSEVVSSNDLLLQFQDRLSPPDAFSLLAPSNGQSSVPRTVQLDWEEALHADSYNVYLGTSAPPPFVTNTADSQLAQSLLAEANYSWHIVATNDYGTTRSPTGGEWTFVTALWDAEITTNTHISPSNTTYDGQDILVDGATLTLDGCHTFGWVGVTNGGQITHTTGLETGLCIVAGNLVVSGDSTIDVSERGLEANGSVSVSGGSYGGRGAFWSTSESNPTYGDYREPDELGSGTVGTEFRGGGRVRIQADTLQLDGQIRSVGRYGISTTGGGGSGGAIWLDVGTLSGSGTIQADGAGADSYSGGGGGRVAVYYDDASGFDLSNNVSCLGGNGGSTRDGGAGTIYLRDKADAVGVLRIENFTTHVDAQSTDIKQLVVEPVEVTTAEVVYEEAITSTQFRVTSGRITQNGLSVISNLAVNGTTWNQNTGLVVCSLGVTNVTWTQNGPLTACVASVSGGTWTQNGDFSVTSRVLNVTGTTWTQNGVLDVDTLNVSGLTWTQNTNLTLTAMNGSNVTWTANGLFTAQHLALSGGGTWTFNDVLTISGSYDFGSAIVNINGPFSLPTDDIIVDGWTWTVNSTQCWDEVHVINGGKITHSAGALVTGVWIKANTVTVSSDSSIDVSERGLLSPAGISGTEGGSHGGRGGVGSIGTTIPDPTFGDLRHPDALGVGGNDNKSRGGGRIRIEAGSLQLDGNMFANGQVPTSSFRTGASGGSIWLDVGTLTGTGLIRADGSTHTGNANYGGGGGGRVAITYDDVSGYDLANLVRSIGGNGGSDVYDGGAGTVYLKDNAQPEGVVRIDNTGRGASANHTDILTNLTEEVWVRTARAWFYEPVTSLVFNATNANVTQDAPFCVTNLSVYGGTWVQTTTGELCAASLGVTNVTWTQNGALTAGVFGVSACTWVQNAPISLYTPSLSVDSSVWTQNGSLNVAQLDVVGGTWTQNTNANRSSLTASNVTWTQNGQTAVQNLDLHDGTYTFNDALFVSNTFMIHSADLVQNAAISIPGDDMMVDDWTWTLNVTQVWDEVHVVNGGLICHGTGIKVTGVWLNANQILVDSNSAIDASDKGLLTPAGLTGTAGASHGGAGGVPSGTSNPIYGSDVMPDALGVGGNDNKSRGGGRIRIVSDVLQLDGDLLANGQLPVSSFRTGASGGSIWLDLGVLSGDGLIRAEGSRHTGNANYGSGGGGRVAVYYDDASGFDLSNNVTVAGGDGTGAWDGQTGTIFFAAQTNPVRVVSASPQGAVSQSVDRVELIFSPAIDAASFTTVDVLVVTATTTNFPNAITQSNAVKFFIEFSPALGEATHTIVVGPNILNLGGTAMDQDEDATPGEIPDDQFVLVLDVDLTDPSPPVVTNFAMGPAVNNIAANSASLEGTRDSNTTVYVDGTLRVANGSSPWSYTVSLSQGSNTVELFSTDLAGNSSAITQVLFYADNVAPVITGVTPTDFEYTSNAATTVAITYTEATSGLDLGASSLSVAIGGTNPVSGSWSTDGSTATFTPSNALADAEYHVNVTFRDALSNASPPFASQFEVDTTAPDPPGIDPVTSPTAFSNQVVGGTREPFAEVQLTGTVAEVRGAASTWNVNVPLQAFSNAFSFTQIDRAGNESAPTNVMIYYADPAPYVTMDNLPVEGSDTNTAIINDFYVTFSETMNADTVTNPAAGRHVLQSSGSDLVLDNGNDHFYQLDVAYVGICTADYSVVDGPLQPGVYRFVISNLLEDLVGNTMTTDYVRTFTMIDPPLFVLENQSNSVAAAATPLALVEHPADLHIAGGRGSLIVSNDVDYWSFAAQSNDTVVLGVDVPGNPAGSRVRFSVQDVSGSNLVADLVPGSNGQGETAAIGVPSNGTYLVCAQREDAYAGEYRFRVFLARPPLEIESETNDTVAQATAVTLTAAGITNSGSAAGYIAHNPDLDVFDVGLLTNGQTVLVDAQPLTNSVLDPVIGLYDSNNVLIAEAGGGIVDDGFAQVRIDTNGNYFARVSDKNTTGSLLHPYVLEVSVLPTAALTLPNLQVASVSLPTNATINSGDSVAIGFTVTNSGSLVTPTNTWTDRVVLSTNATYGDADDTQLGDFVRVGALAANTGYETNPVVSFPDGIEGDYYLIVGTDDGEIVDEGFFESDNRRVSASTFTINLADYPDLQVEELAVSGTNEVGEPLLVSWNTANRGSSSTSTSFYERILVSNETTGAVLLDSESLEASTLGIFAQLARSTSVTATAAGVYRFEITTDSQDDLFEYDAGGHASAEQNTTSTTLQVDQYYAIALDTNPAAAGALTGSGRYLANSSVTVTATANTNDLPYFFVNWTESAVPQSTNPVFVFAITADRNLVGNFSLPSFAVTAVSQPTGGGSVSGTGTFFYAQTNILTATTNAGYQFVEWLVGATNVGNSVSITNVIFTNRAFVAVFDAIIKTHTVATATTPTNIAVVTGAGNYTNFQAATFSAPLVTTNAGFRYTFQEFKENGSAVSTSNIYERTFVPADPSNLTITAVYSGVSIKPLLAAVSANFTNPVPCVTNFMLTLQFDRSMSTSPEPTILITNESSGAFLVSTTNGLWQTTALSNDTYKGSSFVFTNGVMDGTNNVIVSDAKDAADVLMDSSNAFAVVIDSTKPPHPVLAVVDTNRVSLTIGWAAYAAPSDLREFRVYRATANFSSIEGLTPLAVLGESVRSNTFTDLVIDTPYYTAVTAVDDAGNQDPEVTPLMIVLANSSFAPSAPQVNPVTSPTTIRRQLVNGAKDAGADIRLNSVQVVPVSNNTGWQVEVTLTPGTNELSFTSVDAFGFASPATVVEIVFNDTAPGPIVVEGDGVGDGISAQLTWTNYDEVANGDDIVRYEIYQGSNLFAHSSNATSIGSTTVGSQSFSATGLTRNTTFYFAAVAVDEASNATHSVTSTAVLTSDIVPPANPSGLFFDVFDTNLVLHWTPPPDTDGDLAGFKVYFTNGPVGTPVGLTINMFNQPALTNATSYDFRVTSLDNDANESSGASKSGVTVLPNPTSLAAIEYDSLISLSWNVVGPAPFVKHYAVYQDTVPFTSVTGRTPVVTTTSTNRSVAGLVNGTVYYFAIVTVNISDGFDPAVTNIAATPMPDTTAPGLASFLFEGSAVSNGFVVDRPGTFTVSATDISGVSHVEFLVDGVLKFTDTINTYSYFWDVTAETDGVHQVVIHALDAFNNQGAITAGVTVALAAPQTVPTITSPADGLIINRTLNTIAGTANNYSDSVQLFLNAAPTGGTGSVEVDGTFSFGGTLQEGTNLVQAAEVNRGGTGPLSTSITVVVDSTVPGPPARVDAVAQPGGVIRVTWRPPSDSRIDGYDLYRHTESFESTAGVTRVNSALLTVKTFDDLPVVDGTYTYRMVTRNYLGTLSILSTPASATSDRTPPSADVEYESTGASDGTRFSIGTVTVAIEVSEPLLTSPFFSIVRTNGPPIPLLLTQTSSNSYEGEFDIEPGGPQGFAFANFSARDELGNRGTDLTSGQVILIDSIGPSVTGLVVNPANPIRNIASNPVPVTVTLAFDPNDVPTVSPSLWHSLSESQPSNLPVALSMTGAATYEGTIALTAASGTNNETLSLSYSGIDQVQNVGTGFVGRSRFEVYQDELPPLDAPTGLTGVADTGGVVRLSWDSLEEASDYLVYRQAPGEGSMSERGTSTGAVTFVEIAPDGTNDYALASIRTANGQVSTGAQGSVVSVVADGTSPSAPTGVVMTVSGSGILLTWSAPPDADVVDYNVYRDSQAVNSTTGLVPLIEGTPLTSALDSAPAPGGIYYAITALDEVGNESVPSSSVFTNLALLPVSSMIVKKTDDNLPVVQWTHEDTGNIDGFNLYVDIGGVPTRVTDPILGSAVAMYTDTGYTGSNRLYTLAAVDVAGTNEVESESRSLLLPDVAVGLGQGERIGRGCINRFEYVVSNRSGSAISDVRIGAAFGGVEHLSDSVDLAVNAVTSVTVAVGGYSSLPDAVTVSNSITISASETDSVMITRTQVLSAVDDLLSLEILNDALQRGVSGDVRFELHNTCDEQIEIVLGRNGGASDEVRFKLLDQDGSVYAVLAVAQFVGSDVVTLANGTTVARIEPGSSFRSAAFSLAVPSSAPLESVLRLEIDALHHNLGEDNHVVVAGFDGSRSVMLGNFVVVSAAVASDFTDSGITAESGQMTVIQLSYTAEATNVTPQVSNASTGIVITGNATEFGSGRPMPRTPVKLVISLRGFERRFDLFTDSFGAWSYTFNPGTQEGGNYRAYAVHPLVSETRDQLEFSIHRVLYSPHSGPLTVPFGYAQVVDISVVSLGQVLTNAQLGYHAEDQPGATFPVGITVSNHAPVPQIVDAQQATLLATITGSTNAMTNGTMVLRVESSGSPTSTWGLVTIDYEFLTPPAGVPPAVATAFPILTWGPTFVETGVAVSNSVVEQVIFLNRGYTNLTGVQLSLIDTNGSAAPSWLALNSSSNIGSIAVGATRPVELTFAPDETVSPSGSLPYEFRLRIESSNYPAREVQLFVHVDNTGMGNALFKVMDIFTGTFDETNSLVEGVTGANVQLVKEGGTLFVTNVTTDTVGDVLVQDLPVGRYRVRITGPDHNPRDDTIIIRAGATTSREYTLLNNVIQVEFSVREITIEDRYEIVLSTTFKTDVPIAVVVVNPPSVSIPDMEVGEVFQGEFTLKNYGLTRATELVVEIPPPQSVL